MYDQGFPFIFTVQFMSLRLDVDVNKCFVIIDFQLLGVSIYIEGLLLLLLPALADVLNFVVN